MRDVPISQLQAQRLDIVVSQLKAGPFRKDPGDRVTEQFLVVSSGSLFASAHHQGPTALSRVMKVRYQDTLLPSLPLIYEWL